jgi:predicted MPP superfamily phosphohydrolase
VIRFFLRGPSGEIATAALVTEFLFATAAVIGHAYLLTSLLNVLYGCPLPKKFLKVYRLATGLLILAGPAVFWFLYDMIPGRFQGTVLLYALVCVNAALWFAIVTVVRLLPPKPAAVLAERTETVDYWKQLGPAAIGDGKYRHVARLPFNDVFKVDFTDLTLAVPNLPAAWDGLRILLVSDPHFCGTPSRAFFEAVLDKLAAGPTPDLALLAGDYLDTDTHHDWIAPLLGRLSATEGRYAILGNHDKKHDPDRVRKELAAAGYTVLVNAWTEATVRGVRCVLVGHEGPWFRPGPDLTDAPPDQFRLCLSHTPDNFYWGQRHHVGLMLCGHVHGGQVRIPVVGSIFVPSIYGRRFDMGVFEGGGTVMVVGRGLSGKEPLRFRCHPQVIRLTLRPAS